MAIDRKALLEITKTLVGSIINKVPIQQQMVQKLSQILDVKRCVVFKIFSQNSGEEWCEITAGVGGHGLGLREPIVKHPDLEEIIKIKKILVITDPKENPLTSHFRAIIEKENITQILYLPLISELEAKLEAKTIGIIVIDATGEKQEFSPDEIEFCAEVGELISLIIGQEEILIQEMRDEILNRIVPLGGFARRIDKLTKEFSSNVKIIIEETQRVEEMFPKEGRRRNF